MTRDEWCAKRLAEIRNPHDPTTERVFLRLMREAWNAGYAAKHGNVTSNPPSDQAFMSDGVRQPDPGLIEEMRKLRDKLKGRRRLAVVKECTIDGEPT